MTRSNVRSASQGLTETKCTHCKIGELSLRWVANNKTNHYGKQDSVWNLHANLKGKYGIVPRADCHERNLCNKKRRTNKNGDK
jgi:hypothetical protein